MYFNMISIVQKKRLATILYDVFHLYILEQNARNIYFYNKSKDH